MKMTSYLFYFLFAAGFIFSMVVLGLNPADQKQATASSKSIKQVKEANRKSVWLNSRNFPYYQERQCPFYIIKPGC